METNNLYKNGVSSPSATLRQMLAGFQVTQLIYVAAKLGLADMLADGPRSGAELASIAGADSLTLQRLLRALACIGVFKHIEGGRFGLTDVGDYLRTDTPGSLRAVAIFSGDAWVERAWGGLLHATQTGLDAVRLAITLEARLLLADDWTDPTHTLPALAPLVAGDFFVFTGGGDVYSEEEVHAWLNESGWRPVGFTPLAGPHSVIIVETPPEQVIALRGFQALQGVVARDWLSQRKGWR